VEKIDLLISWADPTSYWSTS